MPKPLSTQRGTSARTGELIASAVRTLEVEATGITTLSAAIHDGLGRAFIAARGSRRRPRGASPVFPSLRGRFT